MMKDDVSTSIAILGVLIWLGVIITVAIGYILNIVDLFNDLSTVNGVFIMRIIGIFLPPIGAIMGYFF